MSDWIQNITVISGSKETLTTIHDCNFDFERIHPYDTESKAPRSEWYYEVWGTPEPAKDITFTRDGADLRITYRTRLNTPHGIFACLTLHDETLQVKTTWARDGVEAVGIATYERGQITSKSFDPTDFKPSAVKRFAAENPWFSYSAFRANCWESEETSEMCEDLGSEIVFNQWQKSYMQWLDDNMPR
jgi:hypothetical protein